MTAVSAVVLCRSGCLIRSHRHLCSRSSPFGSLILAVLILLATASARADGLFGSIEFHSSNLAAIPQWTSVIQRIHEQQDAFDACDADESSCRNARMREWRQLIRDIGDLPQEEQLRRVNRFANSIVPYITDSDNYGTSDYWASPVEFLDRSGDCEDYAIIKFVSLRELGVAQERMRIAVVMDSVRNIPHAVLVVETPETMYILDSLFDAVLEHTRVVQYVPQYSVNLTTRWAHINR